MKSRMPDDYQVDDDPDAKHSRMDAQYLRTCFGLRAKPGEKPPELPLAVRRAHYEMSQALSIFGAIGPTGLSLTELAVVATLARRDDSLELAEPEVPKYSFLPEVEAGNVVEGQKVVVHYQKKDQAAHFLRVEKKKLVKLVLLVNSNEIRFRPDLVRYPEEGEFPEVAENINVTVSA